MDWNSTYQLSEQHRNDLLNTAAEARLARIARKGKSNLFQSLVARFAKPTPQPAVIAKVDTLPVPGKTTVAA
jgi:hypothetical protein